MEAAALPLSPAASSPPWFQVRLKRGNNTLQTNLRRLRAPVGGNRDFKEKEAVIHCGEIYV